MRLIIAGGRDFVDKGRLAQAIRLYDIEPSEIISGGARGADLTGEAYAKTKEIKLTIFPADWKKHGKGAGIIRNRHMAHYADRLLVFWDGISRGTKNMIDTMEGLGKPVNIVRYL